MEDRHPTYPARVGFAGFWLWAAVIVAVGAAVGFVVTVIMEGGAIGH